MKLFVKWLNSKNSVDDSFQINTFLSAKEYIDDSLNIALTLISIQNECINLYNRRIYDGDNKKIGNRHVQICSNYFAFILLPKTKIDINNIITVNSNVMH